VPAFLVSLVLTLPLSIVLARLFASVFEIPFLRHRSSSWAVRRQQARAEGTPG
jgi:peptidoglycan/LPS O-acetylase OafA/YrhL